ncbi:heme ABC exporter ATP-binding protein CcmA [Roseateles cellulosilyticus]|uniref:Heme ABC exporter ATP-binding protein CcmA n=1 Tax=Pelomonas cellulosilytica TaxID=2906762 RepID=A0ABS8XT05_9BURK|nr:heme ABC exporter ATP-binding protein CcmA [Pelomonas sp. P8]MCE4553966.1 heme ABC exporter ATP-binding protein CcmA [Pelomonas sp. P8]
MPLASMLPSAAPPSLILQRVGQSRGGRQLFEGVDVALHPGQLLWVQGANGSGKTSLLRVICGLTTPRVGRVHVGQALLYIGHRPGLKDVLSVIEQLRSSAALAGRPCTEGDALAALAPVGLDDAAGLRLAQLSEGQRRRVALAQLWLPRVPPLWVLDEPLAALDMAMADRLAQRLDRHADEGGSAVFTSHQALPLRRAVRTLSLGTL